MNKQHYLISKNLKKITTIVCSFLFVSFAFSQNVQWAKRIGSINEDVGEAMTIDPFGNIIITGSYWGTVDFDPSAATYSLTSASSNRDIFVGKYDNSGALIWVKKMGGSGPDHPHGITTDSIGNVYTTGYFNSSTLDFDPGPGTYTLSSTGNNGDVFIQKLDKNGNFKWACKIGGPNNDWCYSIATDNNENVYITGKYSGTWDFDPGFGTYNLTAAGGNDGYVLKLDVNGNFVWVKSIGWPGEDDGKAVKLDSQGNLYVTGYGWATGTQYVAYVHKYTSNGDLIWEKYLEGPNSSYGGYLDIDDLGNVVITGHFTGTVDFNPGFPETCYLSSINGSRDIFFLKLDNDGNFIWAKSIGSISDEYPTSIVIDKYKNIYTSGYFYGTLDMNPAVDLNNIISEGSFDGFISVLDNEGNYINATNIGGSGYNTTGSIDVDASGKIYVAGSFYDTLKFPPTSFQPNLISAGDLDIFVSKYTQKGISGYIYNDINQNCQKGATEPGLKHYLGLITPGNIVIETDNNGRWFVDSLPVGNYTITFDVPNHWLATCTNTVSFIVNSGSSYITAPNFGLISVSPCSKPDVSMVVQSLRRCFSNQKIYIQSCNLPSATGAINNAYVDVLLDSLTYVDSASVPYTGLGNNYYRFSIDTLNPDQCVSFVVYTRLGCQAMLGRTMCMKAYLFPIDSCALDNTAEPSLPIGPGTPAPCALPWDHSSLSVYGYCLNDTVHFIVSNNGIPMSGNMQCQSPVRVYIDGILSYTYFITLEGGESIEYSYPGNGQTWVLQADQHPLHPGNSHPNAHVEACGDLVNWTPNLVNTLPLDDEDPAVDEYCGQVTGSYDPNDKTGFPLGLGTQHEILPNQQLQYMIRFQNTGTDTAFTVVIRDTLDMDLNIFSVVPGAASHPYTFRMYGPRVLEWTFNNILLPDSAHNEPESHGVVTFRVDQKINLSNGTTILNDADIYFDFNDPVITNQTMHTINNQIHNYVTKMNDEQENNTQFKIYPNPTSGVLNINVPKELIGTGYIIRNQLGQIIMKGRLNIELNSLDISKLSSGFYIFSIESNSTKQSIKLIKQ